MKMKKIHEWKKNHVSVDLLIFMVSAEVLKRSGTATLKLPEIITIAREETTDNFSWQIFPGQSFYDFSIRMLSQVRMRHGISYLSRENCVNWIATLLHSNLFIEEMQTLTFQIRFFLPSQQCIFLWDRLFFDV